MTITRQNVEKTLIRRCSAVMALVGFDVDASGANEDLNDPIATALRDMGGTVADITNVSDSDLAIVAGDEVNLFLTLAEIRLLNSIVTNMTIVNISLGQRSESFGQIPDRLQNKIASLVETARTQYNFGYGTITAGGLELDIADHNEDLAEEYEE